MKLRAAGGHGTIAMAVEKIIGKEGQ